MLGDDGAADRGNSFIIHRSKDKSMKTLFIITSMIILFGFMQSADGQMLHLNAAYGRATTALTKIDFGQKVFFFGITSDTTAGTDTLWASTDSAVTRMFAGQITVSSRILIRAGESASLEGLQGRYLWIQMSGNTSKFRIFSSR